ncbi:MAG TPA: histone deacetylase [Acidimicrobiales bacterium]|nr:histone deacetylase [Acidimicrobiales bacterium]
MTAGAVLFGSLVGIDEHDTGPHHPERPDRLRAVVRGVDDAPVAAAVVPVAPRAATRGELARVHDEAYLDAVARFSLAGGGDLDPDTVVSTGSWNTAVQAAGLGLAAIEALQHGDADAAFVAPRPPGHHATRARGMGFCLVNNIAVGAAALADAGERVLIVDWDVHHGNGTQDIFWDDPRVLYVSTHQWPAYPGTGRASEVGGPSARGLTVNVPLPPGATGEAARAAFDEVIAPVVDSFAPTWVLISAGFDAHRDDPLAELAWSAADYGDLTARVAAYAPARGRVVAYLEGGYDLAALARSAAVTISALAGVRWAPEPATNGGPGREAVAAARRIRTQALDAQSPDSPNW